MSASHIKSVPLVFMHNRVIFCLYPTIECSRKKQSIKKEK
jgi:hypothetical protein